MKLRGEGITIITQHRHNVTQDLHTITVAPQVIASAL